MVLSGSVDNTLKIWAITTDERENKRYIKDFYSFGGEIIIGKI